MLKGQPTIKSKPRLGRFNLFIGETDAIDNYPEIAIETGDFGSWDTEAIQDEHISHFVGEISSDDLAMLESTLKIFGVSIGEKDVSALSKSNRLIVFWLAYTISGFPGIPVCFKEFARYCDPRTGRRLTQELVGIARKLDRTILLSTNNIGCLDGLDLIDDEQRLFVVSFNQEEVPIARRIKEPTPLKGQERVDISEAYLRGYIGGLHSRNF